MTKILIEPHYLGSLEYFVLLSRFDEICFEVCDSMRKQTYRNRCYFLLSNKVQPLMVPVKYSNGDVTGDVRIDHSQRWVKDHWGAFYSAYGKAPFFEYFEQDFREIWDRQWDLLIDLNMAFFQLCCKILRWDKKVTKSTDYTFSIEPDYRDLVNPKKPFSGRNIYRVSPYMQLFGDNFTPNLSVVDLLMNEGSEAARIIKESTMQ